MRTGFPKSTPSDDYVRAIAKSVFNINDKLLDRVLSSRKDASSPTREDTTKSQQ
ncbi:MAG: DUF2192 domain-containing protein [Desulfurococcaceae archaeon]